MLFSFGVKNKSKQIKIIIGSLLIAIFAFLFTFSFSSGDNPVNINGLIFKFRLIKEPLNYFIKDLHIIVIVINIVFMFFIASGVAILYGVVEKFIIKDIIKYLSIIFITFSGYIYYTSSTAAIEFSQTSNAARTVISHLADYTPISNNINIFQILIIIQIGIFHCFVFWLVNFKFNYHRLKTNNLYGN